jgi:hypothetical protein
MRSNYLAKTCSLPIRQVGGFHRVFEKALTKLVDPTFTDQMRGQPSLAVRHTTSTRNSLQTPRREDVAGNMTDLVAAWTAGLLSSVSDDLSVFYRMTMTR